MAKKSAFSKGYRKQTNEKKPYLSKKEIIALVVIVLVIIVGVILFNNLYDDGSLKIRGGQLRVSGENNIIYNAQTIDNPSYFKVGELHDVEGYALESAIFGTDENLHTYTLTPEVEDAGYNITVRASGQDAETLSSTMPAYMRSYLTDYEASDVTKLDNDGHPVWYFIGSYSSQVAAQTEEAAEETAAETDTEESAAEEDVDTQEETETDAEAAPAEEEAEAGETETVADAETAEAETEEQEAGETEAEDVDADPEAETEAEAVETTAVYHKELAAYISNGTARTICIHVAQDADSEDALMTDDAFESALQDVLGGLTYETK